MGIDIPLLSARGKGFGEEALTLFIHYLIEQGHRSIYTQTWPGNLRMIRLTQKLRFKEFIVK